jgi:hypothetical protein
MDVTRREAEGCDCLQGNFFTKIIVIAWENFARAGVPSEIRIFTVFLITAFNLRLPSLVIYSDSLLQCQILSDKNLIQIE